MIRRRGGEKARGSARLRAVRRPWWRSRKLLVAVVVVIVLLGALLVAGPSIGRWYLLQRVVPRMAERFGRKLSIGATKVSYGELLLNGVILRTAADGKQPTAKVRRVRARFELLPLLSGRVVVNEVTVDGLRLRLWRRVEGKSNFADLLERRRRSAKKKRGASRVRVDRIRLRSGTLEVQDQQHGLLVSADQVEGVMKRGERPTLSLGDVAINADQLPDTITFGSMQIKRDAKKATLLELGGGAIRVLPRLLLSGITGKLRYSDGKVTTKMSGSYGGATARLWAASGWFVPTKRTGKIEIKAAKFRLDRIASILTKTPVVRPHRTVVNGRFTADFKPDVVKLVGSFAFSDLNLFHQLVAKTPVLDLSLVTQLDASYLRKERTLDLQRLHFQSRGVEATVSGRVERIGQQPLIALKLEVEPLPCQTLLEAFPPSLVPKLQGFKLKGKRGLDLHARIDYSDLKKVELGGTVGFRRCKVVGAPEAMSAARLQKPFEHIVEITPDEMLTVVIGPDNPDFAPFDEISKHAMNAFLTTEDASFFRHRGFIPSQFRAALARNLSHGGFRLGASTISMQTVKNVLLTHEKTLSRKLQELFLTWYLEQELTKERLMEIYLNAIEFGPRIYGIGRAAQHYFGKTAKELTPMEAAFFSSILPSPKRRYVQYCQGKLSKKWDKYVRRILKRMYQRMWLSDTEYEEAQKEELVFARDFEALPEKDCRDQIAALVGDRIHPSK